MKVAGVTCEEVRAALKEWDTAPVYVDRDRPQERVFNQEGGWTCWGRLRGERGYKVIRNVCVRGPQVVVYSVF